MEKRRRKQNWWRRMKPLWKKNQKRNLLWLNLHRKTKQTPAGSPGPMWKVQLSTDSLELSFIWTDCQESMKLFKLKWNNLFSWKLSQLLQHRRMENHWKKYMCKVCKKVFNRQDNLERHQKKQDSSDNQHCPECLKVFIRQDALDEHLHQQHGWPSVKQAVDNQEGWGPSKKQNLEKKDDPCQIYSINMIKEQCIPKFRTTESTLQGVIQRHWGNRGCVIYSQENVCGYYWRPDQGSNVWRFGETDSTILVARLTYSDTLCKDTWT